MKVLILFILITAFQVQAEDVMGQTVTQEVKRTEIHKALSTIEKQGSDYLFTKGKLFAGQ